MQVVRGSSGDVSRRRRASALALLGVAMCLSLGGFPSPISSASASRTHSVQLTVSAHLHYVSSKGSYLLEEGPATGALAGVVRAKLRVTAGISGSFTFLPHGEAINGVGSATLHESGTYASFGGSLKILGGTGRYAHAHGEGGLYGVFNRQSLAVTIKTTGSLSY
jgi:hypothetical protein